MAWSTGSIPNNNAGNMITILDSLLPANSYWSIYDAAAGVNKKCYRCQDTPNNVLFYVVCNDNQVNYAKMEIWQGWDALGHLGTGYGLTGDYRFYRKQGDYAMSVLDNRFIFLQTAPYYTSCYLGELKRIDASRSNPIIVSQGGNGEWANALAMINDGASSQWKFFMTPFGQYNISGETYCYNNNVRRPLLSDGRFLVWETPIMDVHSYRIAGQLDGVMQIAQPATPPALGLSNGDTVTVGSTVWYVCKGTTGSDWVTFIRET